MSDQTIEAQIQKLTADLAVLAKSVAKSGSERAGAYQAKASRYAHDTYGASIDALGDFRSELGSIEEAVVARVRSHPLRTIGILGGLALFLILQTGRKSE